MKYVRRLGVLSTGMMLCLIYAVIGLIAGLIMAGIFSMAGALGSAMDVPGSPMALWAGMGAAVIIIMPIMMAVYGFVVGVIGAAIYNLFARWTGGIKIDLVDETP